MIKATFSFSQIYKADGRPVLKRHKQRHRQGDERHKAGLLDGWVIIRVAHFLYHSLFFFKLSAFFLTYSLAFSFMHCHCLFFIFHYIKMTYVYSLWNSPDELLKWLFCECVLIWAWSQRLLITVYFSSGDLWLVRVSVKIATCFLSWVKLGMWWCIIIIFSIRIG